MASMHIYADTGNGRDKTVYTAWWFPKVSKGLPKRSRVYMLNKKKKRMPDPIDVVIPPTSQLKVDPKLFAKTYATSFAVSRAEINRLNKWLGDTQKCIK